MRPNRRDEVEPVPGLAPRVRALDWAGFARIDLMRPRNTRPAGWPGPRSANRSMARPEFPNPTRKRSLDRRTQTEHLGKRQGGA